MHHGERAHLRSRRVPASPPASPASSPTRPGIRSLTRSVATRRRPATARPTSARRTTSPAPRAAGKTVAIVDAYDDPTAEADLGVYRSQYGLPPCTTANGCFRKVEPDRRHAATRAATPAGPRRSPRPRHGLGDLPRLPHPARRGQQRLVREPRRGGQLRGDAGRVGDQQQLRRQRQRAQLVGTTTTPASPSPRPPATAATASSPRPASRSVVAVGGTSLTRSRQRRAAGARRRGAAPAAAARRSTPSRRGRPRPPSARGKANADVSAVADPNTGVAVYDSTPYQGYIGLAGLRRHERLVADHRQRLRAGRQRRPATRRPYTWEHTPGLNDVTTGSNGTCSPSVWCHAGAGWDGPTGLGTPNGTSSF